MVSGDSPAVTVTSMEVPIPARPTPTMAAPTAAAPTGPTTILVKFDEYDGSDDEDAAAAAAALADDSLLHFYCGSYFNVPTADAEPPFYCISRGRYIGVFSGW